MSEQTSFDVAILMGSKNDWETMQAAADVLAELNIPYQARVLSAHRTPAETADYVHAADAAGVQVFIAGAGLAAHLAGAIAAHTVKPVLGVPLPAGGLGGLDALLATVQMPGGIPVGTLAVGKPGATNAGLLAAAIIGLTRPDVLEQLRQRRRRAAEKILSERLD